jgi:DNA modification methylase
LRVEQEGLFAPAVPKVHRGQVYRLGRHRLMCGDATSKDDVARLLQGDKPNLVITSPPYAKQRDYDRPIACWDSMMMRAFDGHKFEDDVQMLVNLGSYHRKGEVILYWQDWIKAMRNASWLHHAQYIWHKKVCLPHAIRTRLTPNFEYILHLTKKPKDCVSCVRTVGAGDNALNHKSRQRKRDGTKARQRQAWTKISSMKIQNAVLSTSILHPKEATGHPAQMPQSIVSLLIQSFNHGKTITYDPFCGSGTTLMAAEAEHVIGTGMEISPQYVEMAIKRWQNAYPEQPVILS